MRWIKPSFSIIFTLAGWVSSIFSLFKLEHFKPESRMAIIIIVVFLSVIYIGTQLYSLYKTGFNSSIHNTKQEVNKYLLDWLNKGSRTVIFTRDLTWADESADILNILEKKARNKELTICLYRNTDTTNRLRALGAEVYVHNLSENQLKSRFTIIDYGKSNPKITVGTRNNSGQFVNERYDMRTNPNACTAFIELFELVKNQKITAPYMYDYKQNKQ